MSSVYVWMFRLKCLGLEGQQEDCSMFEVHVQRNCGSRNSSWFVEQSVDQSARIDAGGWRQMTAADNIPVGRVEWIVVVSSRLVFATSFLECCWSAMSECRKRMSCHCQNCRTLNRETVNPPEHRRRPYCVRAWTTHPYSVRSHPQHLCVGVKGALQLQRQQRDESNFSHETRHVENWYTCSVYCCHS